MEVPPPATFVRVAVTVACAWTLWNAMAQAARAMRNNLVSLIQGFMIGGILLVVLVVGLGISTASRPNEPRSATGAESARGRKLEERVTRTLHIKAAAVRGIARLDASGD